MAVSKLTGKSSYFKYNGVTISITKYSAKSARDMADSTDSSNYDAASDLVYHAQLPVSIRLDLDVEGRFDLNSTNANLIASLYSNATAVPVQLGLNAGTLYGHGNFDIMDFTCDVPVMDVVTWRATFRSNGVFTPGS